MAELMTLLEGSGVQTDQGIIGFCGVFLIRSGGKTIVFDTAHVGRRLVLLAALKRAGIQPAEVDHVVMSHAHWDHVQNIDVFENADLLIHPDERRYAHRPHRNDWATPQWTGAAIETVRITEVGDGYQIAPGVTVVDVPGHSPGSIAVAVETDEGLACLSGDALHFAEVALTRVNPLVFWNDEQATKSIDRMVSMADVIYPGHDRPFRVVNDKIEYIRPFSFGLTGITTDGKTLREGGFLVQSAPPLADRVMPGIEEQPERLRGAVVPGR
jgi:N-acyl homoserine lactone hydrolase